MNLEAFSWNYLKFIHGKAAPDCIGGVYKNPTDRLVAEGKDL